MKEIKNSPFEILELFTKLYHKHYSLKSLISNLPIEKGQIEPDLFNHSNLEDNFLKASKKAGLTSKILKQDIKDIDELTLPLILIRDDNSAVIVDSILDEKANILLASSGDNVFEVSLDELEKDYSGYLILVSKKFQYHSKKAKTLTKQKHWF